MSFFPGIIEAGSGENMVQNVGDIERNEILQGAIFAEKEADDATSENGPRQRHGKKDNIFHTR